MEKLLFKIISLLKFIFYLIRRGVDILISCLVLLFTAPLMLIIALLIKLEDGGPVLFIQKRTGKDNKPFNIYKFRSMYKFNHNKQRPVEVKYDWIHGVPEDFVFKKTEGHDPDITKIGLFLRKTSLDELPQFLNVLKGDMSIVGPRPEITEITKYYSKEQQKRLKVKPGITGWAQIHGRSDMNNGQKLELDMYYVENHSLLLDIFIILKTVKVVLTTKGAV
ncbi:sugar transferase [Bacillus cereus group sp. RP43]|uniref:sugar transferase n=1 Tax=Bacillus cereus group sp. RP43 TaxID=3040260 RepID=UPI0033994794